MSAAIVYIDFSMCHDLCDPWDTCTCPRSIISTGQVDFTSECHYKYYLCTICYWWHFVAFILRGIFFSSQHSRDLLDPPPPPMGAYFIFLSVRVSAEAFGCCVMISEACQHLSEFGCSLHGNNSSQYRV